jgi:hypothetical protein
VIYSSFIEFIALLRRSLHKDSKERRQAWIEEEAIVLNGSATAVIFLHIPKAAGTTFANIILRQFPSDAVCRISPYAPEKFISSAEDERRSIKLLLGHMEFGLHQFLPQPSTYITMLRDPVERVRSTYNFILRKPEHPYHQALREGKVGLMEFVERGISRIDTDNGQVRLLSGVQNHSVPLGKCTREMLEKADENLKAYFSVVGLVERFDESLTLMRRQFGWRPPFYRKMNVSKRLIGAERLDEDTKELIRERNVFDLELYDRAARRLEDRLKEQPESFWRELRVFQTINRIVGRTGRRSLLGKLLSELWKRSFS